MQKTIRGKTNVVSDSSSDQPTPEYQWPPPRDPNLQYRPDSRNPLHAIITALPVIMLVVGLFFYFRAEDKQMQGLPMLEKSIEASGIFTGVSTTSGRHYLWVEVEGTAKGVRFKPPQLPLLEPLVRGESIDIRMAPSVENSTTYWALHISQSGQTFLDTETGLEP